jgi:hypothetical protein
VAQLRQMSVDRGLAREDDLHAANARSRVGRSCGGRAPESRCAPLPQSSAELDRLLSSRRELPGVGARRTVSRAVHAAEDRAEQ